MPTNQSLPIPQQTHEAFLTHQTSSCGNVHFPKLGGIASSLPLPLVEDEEPHRFPPAIPNVFLSQAALARYNVATGGLPERLVSGSDDFTMFLWQPSTQKAPLQRMTGHVQLINQVGT